MRKRKPSVVVLCSILGFPVTAQSPAQQLIQKSPDTSRHTMQFVTVDTDVKLEVLDWGGTGRPIILLAGLGYDAHLLDQLALKLAPIDHVYGITRRGFGGSSAPKPSCDNYSADRLGDDVLAVMDALTITRPVLAGHSMIGEELSSIGSRHPDRVAGLIYIDAGYLFTFYNDMAAPGEWLFDTFALQRELNQFGSPGPPRNKRAQITHLSEASRPRFQNDLEEE